MLTPSSLRRLAPLGLLLLGGLVSIASAQRRTSSRDWELTCADRGNRDSDSERACTIVERTMPLSGGALTVDGRTNGGINVIGENRRDILVRARIEANARTRARAGELAGEVEINARDGRVFAEGPEPGRREWWSVSYEVHVPATLDLDLRAHNGGIGVKGVSGTLRMGTTNGGIHLEAVSGDVMAETTNGGLHVGLAGDRWQGRGLEATTTNGGVHLSLPAAYNARLEVGTVNGGVDIDFPVTVQGRIGKRITTTLGQGGPTLRLMTTNGGVDVRRH